MVFYAILKLDNINHCYLVMNFPCISLSTLGYALKGINHIIAIEFYWHFIICTMWKHPVLDESLIKFQHFYLCNKPFSWTHLLGDNALDFYII